MPSRLTRSILVLALTCALSPVAAAHNPMPPLPPAEPEYTNNLEGPIINPLGPLHAPPPVVVRRTPVDTGTPTTTAPSITPRRSGATTPSVDYEQWDYWWAFRRGLYDDIVRGGHAPTTTGGIFDLGGGKGAGGANQAMRVSIESKIAPVLVRAARADSKQDERLTIASLLALGKVASSPVHVEVMLRALNEKTGLRRDVRTGAALAFGTLRRATGSTPLPAADLDRVREVLLAALANEQEPPELRACAALALGMLADQPTARTPGLVAGGLFATLRRLERFEDIRIALLVAIGMQPDSSVAEWQRVVLRKAARERKIFDRKIGNREVAAAAHALGRLGAVADIGALKDLYADRRMDDPAVKRGTVLGLAALAGRVAPAQRIRVAKLLLEMSDGAKHRGVGNAAAMALAELVASEAAEGRRSPLLGTGAGDALLRYADKGKAGRRAFGGLALGIVARAIPEETTDRELGAWRVGALRAMREQLSSKRLDPMTRAAFATGLGLARDGRAQETLLGMVESRKTNPTLRSYAAEALGRMGRRNPAVLTVLRKALIEQGSDKLGERVAMALGILGDRQATPLLIAELKRASNQFVRGQTVTALARIGDERAVDTLISVLRSPSTQAVTRAAAAHGLGMVGDLEDRPLRAWFERHVDYLAPSLSTNTALGSL